MPLLLGRHPGLAAHVLGVISNWALIEVVQAEMLADFAKTDAPTALAMYQELTSTEAKRATLKSAAKSSLTDKEFKIYEIIDAALKPARNTRNRFVHYIWGVSDDIDNALILVNPKTLEKFWVHGRHHFRQYEAWDQDQLNDQDLIETAPTVDKSNDLVYTQADLERSVKESDDTLKMIRAYSFFLRQWPELKRSTLPGILDLPPVQLILQARSIQPSSLYID